MSLSLEIKNYRCFADENPLRIEIDRGFTAIVGPNNAGKSTVLRFFFEFRSLFALLSQPMGDMKSTLKGSQTAISFPPTVQDRTEVFHHGNDRAIEISLRVDGADRVEREAPVIDRVHVTVPRQSHGVTYKYFLGGEQLASSDFAITDGFLRQGDRTHADVQTLANASRLLEKTAYLGAFRNAINAGSSDDYFDMSVGQAFIRKWRDLKTGHEIKKNKLVHRITLDIQRLFSFTNLEINAAHNEMDLKLMADGESYKLSELGSGLGQFIMVLATAAMKSPSFVLVDEPELNLHPTLQVDFMTTLASYSGHGVIFATHNLGLARATAERIYSVVRDAKGCAEARHLESTSRLGELLGELSFSGYRELGFRKVLLVEGASDVRTVQQFLRKRRKDREILLLPLGGGQLVNKRSEVQLGEVTRITTDVFALIDSEKSEAQAGLSTDRAGFVEVCRDLGIKVHVTERRALENYLAEGAIRQVKGQMYRALGPYERRDVVSPIWAKSENWIIASHMSWSDVKETDLGRFLESL